MARKVTLRDARLAKELTQKQLAAKAGTSQAQVQRIEAGQVPGILLAVRLATALGMDAERFKWGA